jgi:isoquinoline 1-oxidoreductase subunit alpha
MVAFTINGASANVEADPDTPLLWVGCGIAECGACTVQVNGEPVRSCVTPASEVEGAEVTTIEGLSPDSSHPLQRAWVAEQVPQCGYCQSGQIMQAAALLAQNGNPSREEIVEHMNGNICRCGTYPRIIRAIERAVREG